MKYTITAKEAIEHMASAWQTAAEKSNCSKKQVGSELVGVGTIADFVFSGYGGPSEGLHCTKNAEGLCPRKYMTWAQDGCWALHAEQRALLEAMKYSEKHPFDFKLQNLFDDTEEWVMFVTHGPCDQCLKFMHAFGVSAVVYDTEYKTDYTKWEGHIAIYQLEEFIGVLDGQC